MLREAAGLDRGVSTATTKTRKRCAVSPSDHQRRRRCDLRAKLSVRLNSPSSSSSSSSSRIKRRTMSESSSNRRRHRHAHADVETASARKLVSALWQQHSKGEEEAAEREVLWDAAAAARRSSSDHRRSASVEVLSKLSRRKINALKDDGERSWHGGNAHAHGPGHWFSDMMSNGGTVGGRTPARQGDHRGTGPTVEMQELYNSLTASNELVRVLANVLGPTGALNPTAASLLAALRSELDAARHLVKRAHSRRRRRRVSEDDNDGEDHHHNDVLLLRRQLAEEVRAWKRRYREKAVAAARLVVSELDGERRSRRRAERVGKKLAEALADAEASLRATTRELGLERAARERLEKVCDELANGGGGGTEAEEAAAALEELEREREMLQVADELREERVRMKLAEARIQFEEKNAVVDRMRQELEAFFLGATDEPPNEKEVVQVEDHHQMQMVVLASEFGVDRALLTGEKSGLVEENGEAEDDDDESEGGSDIELNMDGGNSWSYTNNTSSRETTAKNATSSSVHGGGSLSDRATECGGAFDRRSEATTRSRDGLELVQQDWGAADGCSSDDDGTTTKDDQDLDEDAERYEAIKNLREQMLAGHAFLFLSKGEADADSDRHHHHGFTSHVQDGGLW